MLRATFSENNFPAKLVEFGDDPPASKSPDSVWYRESLQTFLVQCYTDLP